MRLQGLDRAAHDLGQVDQLARKTEFLLRKRPEVDRGKVRGKANPFFLGLTKDTGQARVRVLHIKYRALGRLALGQMEVEVEMAVVLAKEEKKGTHGGAHLVP